MRTAKDQLRAAIEACASAGMTLEEIRGECERDFLEVVFKECSGIHTRIARVLGVHRNTLSRRLQHLGLKTVYGGHGGKRVLSR